MGAELGAQLLPEFLIRRRGIIARGLEQGLNLGDRFVFWPGSVPILRAF